MKQALLHLHVCGEDWPGVLGPDGRCLPHLTPIIEAILSGRMVYRFHGANRIERLLELHPWMAARRALADLIAALRRPANFDTAEAYDREIAARYVALMFCSLQTGYSLVYGIGCGCCRDYLECAEDRTAHYREICRSTRFPRHRLRGSDGAAPLAIPTGLLQELWDILQKPARDGRLAELRGRLLEAVACAEPRDLDELQQRLVSIAAHGAPADAVFPDGMLKLPLWFRPKVSMASVLHWPTDEPSCQPDSSLPAIECVADIVSRIIDDVEIAWGDFDSARMSRGVIRAALVAYANGRGYPCR
jgi:hypothetical protein